MDDANTKKDFELDTKENSQSIKWAGKNSGGSNGGKKRGGKSNSKK